MEIPADQQDAFLQASRQTVDALFSVGFEQDLRGFVGYHARLGPHANAWRGVDVEASLTALRFKARDAEVSTYGGFYGLWVNVFFGNTAYDGDAYGPIRMNRWGLPRAPHSLANTMVHELAHRVGLRHPHSDTEFTVALCEPPYIIDVSAAQQPSRRDVRPASKAVRSARATSLLPMSRSHPISCLSGPFQISFLSRRVDRPSGSTAD